MPCPRPRRAVARNNVLDGSLFVCLQKVPAAAVLPPTRPSAAAPPRAAPTRPAPTRPASNDEPPRGRAPPPPEFRFTKDVYTVTVPENSPGRTLLVPAERMGIPLAAVSPSVATEGVVSGPLPEVRFRIVSGDRDRFFKAEERVVGDFCFLQLRTRAGNSDVLNRERRDKYTLGVRATSTALGSSNTRELEANTTVQVRVQDVNDLTPLFYPTEYEVQVAEDTPPNHSVARVAAEDADLGPNGEVSIALVLSAFYDKYIPSPNVFPPNAMMCSRCTTRSRTGARSSGRCTPPRGSSP